MLSSAAIKDGPDSVAAFFKVIRAMGNPDLAPEEIFQAEQDCYGLLSKDDKDEGFFVRIKPFFFTWTPCDGCTDPFQN